MSEIESLAFFLMQQLKSSLRNHIGCKWSAIDYLHKTLGEKPMIDCPLCESKLVTSELDVYVTQCIFGGGELKRYSCPYCNVIFGPLKMFNLNEAELSEEYVLHYNAYDEGDSTELEIKSFFELNPSREGIYLNYGSGKWSNSVNALRNEGWNIFSYDPHVKDNSGEPWFINDRNNLISMKFDGIYSNNVLEHLRHPVRDLNFLSTLLNVGGSMAHSTPCFEYLYEYTRFHLFFYEGVSKDLLARKSGLAVSKFVNDGIYKCLVLNNS